MTVNMKRTVPPEWSDDHMRLPAVRARLVEARKWTYSSAKKVHVAMRGTVLARSESAIAKHENGEHNFTLDELLDYAAFYGASPIWILTGAGHKKVIDQVDQGPQPDDDSPIASRLLWGDLNAMVQAAISLPDAAPSLFNTAPSALIETTLPDSSMNREVPEGYTITVDCRDRTPVHGRIYLFYHDGAVMLRRFHHEGGSSALLSDSTDNYPFIMLGKKTPPTIGRLVSAKKVF